MSEVIIVKRPLVAAAPRRTPVAIVGTALAVLGLGVFVWLSDARAAQQTGDALPPLMSPGSAPTAEPLREQATPTQPAPAASGMFAPQNTPVTLMASPPPRQVGFEPALSSAPQQPVADPMRDRLRAPALVVDLAQNRVQQVSGGTEVRSDSGEERIVASSTTVVGPASGPASDRNLSDTERFSARVGGEEGLPAMRRHNAIAQRQSQPGAAVLPAA